MKNKNLLIYVILILILLGGCSLNNKPVELNELWSIYYNSEVLSFDVKDSLAFIALQEDGLIIKNIKNPNAPVSVWNGDYFTWYSEFVKIYKNYVLIIIGTDVSIIDISDVKNPEYITDIMFEEEPVDIEVKDDIVFFVDYHGNLKIYDLAIPSNPIKISEMKTTGYCYKIQVKDDFLFSADGIKGVSVIDISDNTKPIYLESYNAVGDVRSFDIEDDYIFVANNSKKIAMYEITETGTFVDAGEFGISPMVYGNVEVVGELAYCSAQYGLNYEVFDVSEISSPQKIAYYSLEFAGGQCCTLGDTLYMSNYNSIKAYNADETLNR
jgi:hypothetical protein